MPAADVSEGLEHEAADGVQAGDEDVEGTEAGDIEAPPVAEAVKAT